MSSRANTFKVLALVVLFWAIGAVQGARIEAMRQSELFYRWVVTASSFAGFGETLEPDKSPNLPEPMDDELFAKVTQLAETKLPDLPIEEEDFDFEGNAKGRLLRAARQGEDQLIYSLLTGPDAKPLQKEFDAYLDSNLLQSVGTQLSTSALYSQASQVEGVGLTSLFFGFRKLAANFVWLEVDKHWHGGEMHRMIPLMRTCVALDPNFVDAYLLGAWHLSYNLTAMLPDTPEPLKKLHPKYKKRLGVKEEWYYIAADFLKDGARKNPRDYRLYFDLGYAIYLTKLKDYPNAVLYLDEARRYRHDKWVPRMLYRAMWLNGQYEDAIEGWTDYLIAFPGAYQGQRFIQINRGYLHEARAEDANQCSEAALFARERYLAQAGQARTDGDLQKASELEAQAREAEATAEQMATLSETEWGNARKIWIPLIQNEQDTIAAARMMRQTAMRYVQEGRYIEAVSELDLARYEMLASFDEFSDLMIDVKQKGNLPLTVSERLAVERKREAAIYATDEKFKREYVDCVYRDMLDDLTAD